MKKIRELTEEVEDQSPHSHRTVDPAVQLFHHVVQPLEPAEEGLYHAALI